MESLPTSLMYGIAIFGALVIYGLGIWTGRLLYHPDNWEAPE